MERPGKFIKSMTSPLQFLILLQLKKGSKYGYELFKVIKNEFQGIWELKTGTFYPAIKSLVNKGLVVNEEREYKEYYFLSENGDLLLAKLGERFELEYKFADRYFCTVIKWMPHALKERFLRILQNMHNSNIDVYSQFNLLFENITDHEKKKSILYSMRDLLMNHMTALNKLIHETIGAQ